MVNESGGESVSGADRIHSFDSEAWVFVEAFLGDQQAAIGTAGNTDELRATEVEKPFGSMGLFAG